MKISNGLGTYLVVHREGVYVAIEARADVRVLVLQWLIMLLFILKYRRRKRG